MAQIKVWGQTDKGLRREANQDSFLINTDIGLYIVADGMGGHSGGEVASKMAVDVAEEVVKNHRKNMAPTELLLKAYEEASHRIYDKAAKESAQLAGMGTTMVLMMHRENYMYIANVGDSRAYLHRKPYLWLMTEDHSLLNEQLRSGILKEADIRNFAQRNVITRSVGYERDVLVDVVERNLQAGDRFLLCSDGLSSLVPDHLICDTLNRTPDDLIPQACIEKALAHGGDDNVTVLFGKVV